MCKCCSSECSRCPLTLPRSGYSLKKKKCATQPQGCALKFLPPQRTPSLLTPLIHPLIKDLQKSVFNHVTPCQYRPDICAHIHARENACVASVCVRVCVFHDTFLQSDRPHSCHSLAVKSPYLQNPRHTTWSSTELRAQKSHLKREAHASFLIETHVSH